jgi:flagellar hook protein FlgE
MLSIIKAGMNVASHELNVVSNNVANANSNGFKKSMTSFADIAASGHAEAFTIAAGLGAETETTRAIHSQSTVLTTDKTTDLALLGDGYFMVRSPSAGAGIEFTRNGAFSLDADGFLTTSVERSS